MADQQAEKIKLTKQEHRQNTYQFKSNVEEHNHRIRITKSILEEVREISQNAKGQIQTAKVLCDCYLTVN